MQGDLQAVCPGLLEITGEAGNLWFLRLLTSTDSLIKLAKLRRVTLLKIAGVGAKYATTFSRGRSALILAMKLNWLAK
jgi:hypothetical protein